MNTLTARDMRALLDDAARIEVLTDLLRQKHFEVPYEAVYGAVGAVANIRDRLLKAALADVEVEPVVTGLAPVTTVAMCAAVMP